jgi:hypothetical protein
MSVSSHERMNRVNLVLLLCVSLLAGCYTEYTVRPTQCVAVWVPGHYGPFGRWRPGHWRCR